MRRCAVLACACLLFAPSLLRAQGPGVTDTAWTLRTRAVMTGVSDSSEPEGYKVYSGLAMDVDLTRALGRHLSLDWTIGTQSREVELTTPGAGKLNLGSIEVLPLGMLLQYRFRPGGRFQPYLGAGVTFNVFWEKSGALDSADLSHGVAPTLAAGFDYTISSRMVFNADFRLSRLETELETEGRTAATLALHPSTLAAGVGFRF